MSTSVSVPRLETLKQNVAEIDTRLESLHPRLTALRAEVEKLIEKENRYVRLFAEADVKEKKKIDEALEDVVEKRASLERECKGLSITIAELQENRNRIYPELQELLKAEQAQERKAQIEALRQRHEADKEAERAADKALMAARERTNRSFFLWNAELQQLAADEAAAALEQQKQIWAQNSGPNARNQRQAI